MRLLRNRSIKKPSCIGQILARWTLASIDFGISDNAVTISRIKVRTGTRQFGESRTMVRFSSVADSSTAHVQMDYLICWD